MSREAFYAHFADKEDCFLAAAGAGCELMFQRVLDAPRELPEEADSPARLRAAVRAYLEFLVAEPEFARIFILEFFAAGPAARARRAAAHDWFADLTRRWHERARRENRSWPDVRDEIYPALVGAIYELVSACVREDRIAAVRKLEDPIVELHLTVLAAGGG